MEDVAKFFENLGVNLVSAVFSFGVEVLGSTGQLVIRVVQAPFS